MLAILAVHIERSWEDPGKQFSIFSSDKFSMSPFLSALLLAGCAGCLLLGVLEGSHCCPPGTSPVPGAMHRLSPDQDSPIKPPPLLLEPLLLQSEPELGLFCCF